MNTFHFSSLISFLPALLGAMTVLQAGLNKKIGQEWGLPAAAWLNAAVVLLACCLILLLAFVTKSEQWHFQFRLESFSWWYLVPGLCGLALIFGGPYSMQKWGATHTFILFISAQLLSSLLWDLKVENREISLTRYLGIAITWIGALITLWKK